MSKKEWLIIAALVIVGGAVTGTFVYKNKNSNNMVGIDHSKMSMPEIDTTAYSLNLMSGKSYKPIKPTTLHFDIKQNNKVVKDFDTVHEKKLHLIVVRKDRSNFQHVHPQLDQSSGMFMLDNFNFPTDGDYRVYADFTPSNAKKDSMGVKEAVTPYQDVQVGDSSKYTPQPLGSDRLSNSSNGFDTSFFFAPSDDSAGGATNTDFSAGQESTVAISINKNGQPYKNLQTYLGALGHMVVLGPKLEFIHAHPQASDINNQSGLIIFAVTFPEAGQYKLYLQTQADNQVTTTDYTLTAKTSPSGNTSTQSMPGMNHSGH